MNRWLAAGRAHRLAISLTVLAALIVATIIGWRVGRNPTAGAPGPSSPSAAPTTSTVSQPNRSSEPIGSSQPARPTRAPDPHARAAQDAAARFVRAFTERSYRDDRSAAWIGRAAQLSTPGYAAKLHAQFERVTDAGWADFVARRGVITTTVLSATISTQFHAAASLRLVQVRYATTERPAPTPKPAPPAPLNVFVTLVDGRWLVDQVIALKG